MPLVRVSNGGSPLVLTVSTYADRFSEHRGTLNIPDSHNFKTLTVTSYGTLPSYTDQPRVTVAGVSYARPAVGTVIDIKGKQFSVSVSDANATRTCSITVTLN